MEMVRAGPRVETRSSLVWPDQAQPRPSLCCAPLGRFCCRLFRGARCSRPLLDLLRAGRRQSNLPHELPHGTLTPGAAGEWFPRTCAGIPLGRIDLSAVSALILHKVNRKLAHLLSPLAACTALEPLPEPARCNGRRSKGIGTPLPLSVGTCQSCKNIPRRLHCSRGEYNKRRTQVRRGIRNVRHAER